MRILGFSQKWPKLEQEEFTTFRFPRRDRDWQVGEQVQIVIHPRKKGGGEHLGIAKIIKKELRKIATAHSEYRPTEQEAVEDGFENLKTMNEWFRDTHGSRIFQEPVNKLTLKWLAPPENKGER